MNNKKMKLDTLRLTSFTTTLDNEKEKQIRGGRSENCTVRSSVGACH